VIRRIEHLDAKGTVSRRLILDDVRTVGQVRIAHSMIVTDLKKNRQTRAQLTRIELDTGLPGMDFTPTRLENP
jgi:hypothetical protein